MNQEQAWAEARRRWGDRADASEHRNQFSVEWRFSDIGCTVVGQGQSWEEAFRQADEFDRVKNTPAFVERVLTLRAILNDDYFGGDDQKNLLKIIQSQMELPKLAEKLVAHFRPKLTFVLDHNALPKEKLEQMEAFFDKAEKDLAEFTSKFPPVLPF